MSSPVPTPSRNDTLRTLPGDLLRSRELLADLIRKDLRVRYRYAAVGLLWAALEPLAYMATLTFVFQWVLAPRGGTAMFGEETPYAVGLLCGLIFWQFTANSIAAASSALVDNQHLVKKVNFTREVVPLAVMGYPAVALAIGIVILVAVHVLLGGHLGAGLLWLPALLAIQAAGTAGMALLVSAGNARYRDVGYMVNVALVLGFYASPVFYDLELVRSAGDRLPGVVTTLYMANPMAGLLSAYREVILAGRAPELELLWWPACVAVLALWGGAVVFRRSAATVSDYL